MARSQRQHDADLTRDILENGKMFPFYRAVSILERIGPMSAAPIGGLGPVHRESVHFTHDPEFAFHPGDVSAVRRKESAASPWSTELTGTFLGLFGTASPLPTHFSEELFELDGEEGKSSLQTLYDILHHRLYSLVYRAGRKYRFSAESRSDGTDSFTRRALAFVGVDATAMPEVGLSAAHLLGLAPLLAIRSRSGRALHILLEASLPNIPVEIEEEVEFE